MLLTTIHEQKNSKDLSTYVDGFIVGMKDVSIRSIQQFNKEELFSFKKECDLLNKKLYVNFCKLFMEEELESAKQALEICKEIDVDGIYYADEGLYYLAKQLDMVSKLIYQPETLVTNHMDVHYYLNQGIQSVSLAHELSLDEIQRIASKENNIEILLHGTYSILYSKRPLVSNYLKAHNIEWSKEFQFDLIEQTREDRMPIVEDESGTHIYAEADMKSISQYPSLKEMGIQRFRIDSLFHDDDWTLEILRAYQEDKPIEEGSDIWYGQKSLTRKGDDDE